MNTSDGQDQQASRDRKMELAIASVLRGGVVLAILTIMVGLVIMFVHHHDYMPKTGHVSYRSLVGDHYKFPDSIAGVVRSLGNGDGVGIVVLGLVFLLGTPIARVVTGNIEFLRQRDWKMSLVTFFVLAVLLVSFMLGKRG